MLGEHSDPEAEQLGGGFLPAANRNVDSRTTSMTSGVEPSGYFACANSVSTSSRGSRRRSMM